MIQEPYILEEEIVIHRRYNPNYGNDRLCICGHVYYRHFDSYYMNAVVGCKYCLCCDFKEFAGEFSVIDMFVRENAPDRYKDLLAKRHQAVEFHTMELSNAQAQKTFNEDLLEEHYRLTQKIIDPLMGILPDDSSLLED